MAESKRETRKRREAQKNYCFRLFSSSPAKLTQNPIRAKRLHIHPIILSTFEEVGPVGYQISPIVQCRICKTILTRPKRRYSNLRKHLITQYHRRLEKMIYSSSRGHETDESMEEVSSRTCDEECKKVSNSKGEKKLAEVQKITSEMKNEEAI